MKPTMEINRRLTFVQGPVEMCFPVKEPNTHEKQAAGGRHAFKKAVDKSLGIRRTFLLCQHKILALCI